MTLKSLYIEFYYGEYSAYEKTKNINKYIEENEDFQIDYFTELLLPFNDYNSLLLRTINITDPSFSYNCIEAEILAARFFLDILNNYQENNLSPVQLCTIFNNLETGFMGAPRNLPDNIIYYPTWLESFYDACDWCDETWTLENSPHLIEATKQQIHVIEKWLFFK
ncbi:MULTISPECIES: hypothetical protein [Acinetobacter]|uniref:hypothetical protein n=1 Tax=Acinetobacter TaxID=469 RepID=UPI001E5AD190|nr:MULTISPECIES: hypothetical protein [Acinetobacter]MDS7929430.1 hypothetical protein [Acinetobacter sp. V102_4]UGQ25062.1 hypothetical protein LRO55_11815 [Acinetobacter calcoaceticus]